MSVMPPKSLPSLPWTWMGGYPQRITGPDATLIAEVFESPDDLRSRERLLRMGRIDDLRRGDPMSDVGTAHALGVPPLG